MDRLHESEIKPKISQLIVLECSNCEFAYGYTPKEFRARDLRCVICNHSFSKEEKLEASK